MTGNRVGIVVAVVVAVGCHGQDPQDVGKDRAKARTLYERACELANAAACKKLGKP